jgi:hypothetical protein
VLVAVAIALVAVVCFFLATASVNRHEDALLQAATSQAGSVESSSLATVLSSLGTLATGVTASGDAPGAFATEAGQVVHAPVTVALVHQELNDDVVVAGTGTFRPGQILGGTPYSALRPAGASVSAGPVVRQGLDTEATFVLGPPQVPDGEAIILQFTVDPFEATVLPSGPTYSGLRMALYGSSLTSRSDLVAANDRQLSWGGPVASVAVPVGDDTWTLVASARSPLTGTVAQIAPWLLLVLGLALAVVTGLILTLLAPRLSKGSAVRRPSPLDRAIALRVPARARVRHWTSSPTRTRGRHAPVVGAGDRSTTSWAHPGIEATGVFARTVLHAPDTAVGTTDVATSRTVATQTPRPFYALADWRPDPFGHAELRRFFRGEPMPLVRDGSGERYDAVPTQNHGAPVVPPPPRRSSAPAPVSRALDPPNDAGRAPASGIHLADEADAIAREIEELLAVVSTQAPAPHSDR